MTRKELKQKLQEIRKRKIEKHPTNQDFSDLSLEALESFDEPTTIIIDPGDEFNPINYDGEMGTWSRTRIKEYEESLIS